MEFWRGEVADELSPITDTISNAFETMEDAKNDFVNWVEENHILEAIGATTVLVADLYLWWLSTVPVPGQTVVNPSDINPSDTGSGSIPTFSL